MIKTLPFNALRTLESVVRLRGFGRAADELNISQSAVSQHIRQLEEWLGHRLLIRKNPQIEPTENGTRLAMAVRDGFGAVEVTCDELRYSQKVPNKGLLVAAPPGFAFIWLLPRLLLFDELHPDIPISLSTDPKSLDSASSDADIIIAYSAGGFPGLHCEKLMGESMSPVCAPRLAQEIQSVDDLADQIILQDTVTSAEQTSNWDVWAKELGLHLPKLPRTQTYGQANMVIQAAINGSGVAMGRCPLVEDALKEGKLVYPLSLTAQSQFSYWFVCQHSATQSKATQAFRSWLHSQTTLKKNPTH